jgi:peptidyl-prolyl cis-trans isomerase SurA
MGEEERKEAYEKAQMIFDSLQMGNDFARMAKTYSEDPSSARNGGEIPWFGTGRMIPEFEDACFALEESGDITKPFKSFYGWHIIKLIDKKGIGTYEEMKPELQEKVNRGDRVKTRNERFVARIKNEYGFSESPEALQRVFNAVDNTLLQGNWKSQELSNDPSTLMKIGKRVVTTGEFAAYVESQQSRGKARNPISYLDELYRQFTQEVVMDYEDSRLSEKYPEFRYIYEEYHDGILLFDIMDQNVWSRAISDSIGLTQFHRDHRMDYMWEERADALLVSCGKDADPKRVRRAYKKIMKGKLDEAALNRKYCVSDTLTCITLTPLLVEEGENEMVDAMNGKPGLGSMTTGEDGSVSFVILREMRPAEPKELDEARGQITSDYQNYLEEVWIRELKKKYPVEINRELLERIET